MPAKLMDLRTRQLFRILIPFLNVSNDNISHFFYGSHNFLNLVFCNLSNMHTSGTYHCSLACGTDLLGKFPAQILIFVSGQIQYGRCGTETAVACQGGAWNRLDHAANMRFLSAFHTYQKILP